MAKKEWDRLPNETSKAFEAFNRYITLMPSERSHEKVRIACGYRTICTIQGWSLKYDWIQRALLYDEHREALRRAAEEKADADYYEAERKKHRRHQMLVGQGLYAAGAQAIPHLRDRASILTAHEVAKLIETGAGQVSRALGDPDFVAESRGSAQPVALVSPEFSQFLMDWAKKPNSEVSE